MLANNCLADPAVGGVVLNMRDVSGRTRAEEALRALNAELEQRVQQRTLELVHARDEAESANRAKSEFLSRMSHELRTPMHAILGFGQLLQADAALALAEPSRTHLREILRAGEHLLGLINERARPGAHRGRPAAAAAGAGGAGAAGRRMPAADAAAGAAARVCSCLTRRRWRCRAACGPTATRLKQVLLNLLSNAIKYNRRGGQVRRAA